MEYILFLTNIIYYKMAHLHNLSHFHSRHINNSRQSWLSDIGNKVKGAAEIAGAMKGIYDVGKMVYSGAQAIAPYVATAAMAL